MSYKTGPVTEPMKEMLRATASSDMSVATAASIQMARALELPLRQGVMNGDALPNNIFEPDLLEPGASPEYPISWLTSSNVRDFIAFNIPKTGKIPEKNIEGDYVMVPTFDVGAAIDWPLKYAQHARWNVVGQAMQVLEWMFVRKRNDDGWHAILAAGLSRNAVIYDSLASAGYFSKRLVAVMETAMHRLVGGNQTSMNKGKLTDLFTSPEALEDMRSWTISEVDDFTRRQIYIAGEDATSKTRVFNTNIWALDELGVGQEYQTYYTDILGGSLAASDVELVVGLDLQHRDSFVMPYRMMPTLFEDMQLHRQRRAGYYGWAEWGFGVLDNRRTLIGSF